MKTCKSYLSILLIVCLITSGLITGCGSKKEIQNSNSKTSKKTSENSKGKPKKNVEVTYWFPYGSSPEKGLLDKSIQMFNERNPGIIVKGQFVGGSGSGQGITDKLTVAISGGNPPDVVLFDRFMVAQWASQGMFEDLTQYAKKEKVTKDMFYDFAWEEANYNNKLYALPFDTDCRALFYNKDAFREVGLDPNKPPKTIKELDEYAEKLTKKEGNRYARFGFIPWYSQGWLYTWGWSFGGKFQVNGKITADDPHIIQALEWEKTYSDKYGIENITSFTNASGGGDLNPFAAGMIAMVVSGPWELARLKEQAPDLDYGVTYIPTPTGDKFTSWAGGWSHVVPKDAKHPEVAFKFAKFMTIGEAAKIFGEGTSSFMSYKKINDDFLWVKNDKKSKIFIELFPQSHCRPAISKGQLLWDELATATNNTLYGQGTAKENLAKVTKRVNEALSN